MQKRKIGTTESRARKKCRTGIWKLRLVRIGNFFLGELSAFTKTDLSWRLCFDLLEIQYVETRFKGERAVEKFKYFQNGALQAVFRGKIPERI